MVIENFVPSYNPSQQEEVARIARESCPMAYDDWRSPVLLIHGDGDRNVSLSETVDLVEQLRRHEVHGFLLHENWLRAYRSTANFFDRRLNSDT